MPAAGKRRDRPAGVIIGGLPSASVFCARSSPTGSVPADCWKKPAHVVKITEVLAVEVPDHPGGLADVLEAFVGTAINIEYMYAFPFVRGEKAVLIFRFDQPDAAIERLRESGHQRSRPRRVGRKVMNISRSISAQLENASWIRRMFEEGSRMKRERGAENVYDFTLGNPDQEPPEAVLQALRRVVGSGRPGMHGYMPNPGFGDVRARGGGPDLAQYGPPVQPDDVFMTVGSSGASTSSSNRSSILATR